MLVIDHQADHVLAQSIHEVRKQSTTSRCLYLNTSSVKLRIDELRHKIATLTGEALDLKEGEIYFFDDGDILIISVLMLYKEIKQVISKISQLLSIPEQEIDFTVYDLGAEHSSQLLLKLIEEKRRKKLEEQKILSKQQEQEQAIRRKQAILNVPVPEDAFALIKSRRAEHKETTILMIEDDVFSQRLVEKTLGENYRIISLSNAENAITTYLRVAPDILFLDINLPDVTGHQLLERFLKIDQQAYIVMISGNSDMENIRQAVKLGAKGFVAKPFNREKLLQYIQRCPTKKG